MAVLKVTRRAAVGRGNEVSRLLRSTRLVFVPQSRALWAPLALVHPNLRWRFRPNDPRHRSCRPGRHIWRRNDDGSRALRCSASHRRKATRTAPAEPATMRPPARRWPFGRKHNDSSLRSRLRSRCCSADHRKDTHHGAALVQPFPAKRTGFQSIRPAARDNRRMSAQSLTESGFSLYDCSINFT